MLMSLHITARVILGLIFVLNFVNCEEKRNKWRETAIVLLLKRICFMELVGTLSTLSVVTTSIGDCVVLMEPCMGRVCSNEVF